MKPRLHSALLGVAIAGSVIAVIGFSAGWWVVGTESGARWGFERLGAIFPGKLQAAKLHGTIWGPLRADTVEYRTDRVLITITRVDLDWNLRALPQKRIDIRSLEATGVRMTFAVADSQLPAPKDSLAPELPDLDLPVDLMVKAGMIHDLHITTPGADTALAIDEVTIHDAAFRDTVAIGSLAVHSPLGEVTIAGGGRTRGRYAINLATNWKLNTSRAGTIVGRGRLVGSLDTLRIAQDVSAPFVAHVDGMIFKPMRDLRFDAVVTYEDFDPHTIGDVWPRGRADGRLEIAGKPDLFQSRGTADATTVDYGPLGVRWDVERVHERLDLHSLAMTQPGRPTRFETRGTIAWAGHTTMDLTGTWRDLGWPLKGKILVTSPTGTAHVAGPLERYRVQADAMLATDQFSPTKWQAAGAGNARSIDLRSLQGAFLGGSVTGDARIDWSTPTAWTAKLAARGVDPSTQWRGYPGKVDFDFTGHGRTSGPNVSGAIAIDNVSGTVRQRPVTGRMAASLVPGGVVFAPLEVVWGGDSLVANGRYAQTWDVHWTLAAPDLSVVLPAGAGSFRGQGVLGGSPVYPRLESTFEGDSIVWQERRLNKVTGDVAIDLAPRATSRVQVDAAGLVADRLRLDHATLRGEGPRGDQRLTFSASSDSDSVGLAIQGGLAGNTWRGHVNTLDVASRTFGSWSLEHPATLLAAPDRAALDDFAWHSPPQRVTIATASWRKDGAWSLQSRVEEVKLALLQPFVPPALGLGGAVTGDVSARGTPGGGVLGDARLAVGPGEISYPIADGKREIAHLEPSTVNVHADAAGIAGDAKLALTETGTVDARLRMPGYRTGRIAAEQPVDGHLSLAVRNLGIIQGFVPALSATSGSLEGDLALAGTLARPRWTGHAELANGAADVPQFGMHVTAIQLTARTGDDGRLAFNGSAASGPGKIDLSGTTTLARDGVPEARATLTGDRFQAMNTKDAMVLVSPNIEAALRGDSLAVNGDVVIPQAMITPTTRKKENAISPSSDVVFEGASEDTATRKALKIDGRVRMTLGKEVTFRAFGLDAKPTGSVLAIQRPGQSPTGSGELRITDGTYNVYGQDLHIERGRLIYAGGPIDNPGIDVRASRQANDGVTAGFEVDGTLRTPRLMLFSDPPMAQSDALSYVLLGRSVDKTSRSESGVLTEAATSLGVRGGSVLASSLATKLGITEASVRSEEGGFQDASLMLGMHLSPRLYLHYGVGLAEPVSTLRVQYFLDKRWTVQAEAAAENSGADFLYTVERGKVKALPTKAPGIGPPEPPKPPPAPASTPTTSTAAGP